jgi:hypothetical protein
MHLLNARASQRDDVTRTVRLARNLARHAGRQVRLERRIA